MISVTIPIFVSWSTFKETAAEEEADAEISEDAEEEEIPESGEETEEIA